MCNAFFRDIPVSSFVFHSSLLTVKSVNLVVAHDGFLCVARNYLYFSLWLLWLQRCFSNSSRFALLCNKSNIAGRKGQWIHQFQTETGARSTMVFFIVATLIKDVLFEQFLIRIAVSWDEHSRQRTIMDTSLSDIIEARGTIQWCRMHGDIPSHTTDIIPAHHIIEYSPQVATRTIPHSDMHPTSSHVRILPKTDCSVKRVSYLADHGSTDCRSMDHMIKYQEGQKQGKDCLLCD